MEADTAIAAGLGFIVLCVSHFVAYMIGNFYGARAEAREMRRSQMASFGLTPKQGS